MEVLEGVTYKIRHVISGHSFYITIDDYNGPNDLLDKKYPKAIFVNSRNTEHVAWIGSYMRLLSKYLTILADQNTPFPWDVIDDMLGSFGDSKQNYFIEEKWLKEEFGNNLEVRSLLHHFGLVLKYHCRNLKR